MDTRSFLKELDESGYRKGFQEGIGFGRRYGEQFGFEYATRIGKIQIVFLQLKKILGELSSELTSIIHSSEESKIEQIAFHIFDIHSENDVLKYIYPIKKNINKQKKVG